MVFVISINIVVIIIIIIIMYFCIETLFSWGRAETVARDGRSDHLKGNLRSRYMRMKLMTMKLMTMMMKMMMIKANMMKKNMATVMTIMLTTLHSL